MFSTLKQRLLLGVYVFILLSIPIGAYLASQYQTIKSGASETKTVKTLPKVTPKPTTSPAKELLNSSQTAPGTTGLPPTLTESPAEPSPSTTSPELATSYGPTLAFRAALEGRPTNNQAARVFVGIAEGTLTSNPKFVLSFTVDLPASGEYSNLSLAGLTSGTQYTALLKGPAQIATASAFTMSPNVTNLNSGQPINMLSGDLNDDNVINTADYSIGQKAFGASSNSSNWNELADLNKDGVINAFDLGIIVKNIGKTGDSGAWTSPIPQIATSSASLVPGQSQAMPVGGVATQSSKLNGSGGHWVWIPEF